MKSQSWNKLTPVNRGHISLGKREAEMIEKMDKGGVEVGEGDVVESCSLTCKVLVPCLVRCLVCLMDLEILEPHHSLVLKVFFHHKL